MRRSGAGRSRCETRGPPARVGPGRRRRGRVVGDIRGGIVTVADQQITDQYAIYLGDSMEVMPTFPDGSVHLSVYSPPFAGLYQYSSSERDLSNSTGYPEFLEHYAYFVRELHRLTM